MTSRRAVRTGARVAARTGARLAALFVAVCFAVLVAACGNLAYYAQAVGGHLALLHAARPIAEVLARPSTPELQAKLRQAQAIRDFASAELGLPDNGSYRAYADLGRPYVVWNVFAAAEFSVVPEQWCMLVVGCVNYRGYFDRAAAERLADGLREQGFDTYVAGVPAYSTLGFFDDPLLNTFLRFDEIEVARLLFHELAHQRVFARNDSVFNESFATAVENEGVRRWLAAGAKARLIGNFRQRQQRKAEFAALVAATRRQLAAALAAAPSPAAKRQAKAAVYAGLQRDYAALRASWGGFAGYDAWFGKDLNNAKLASLSVYTQWLPAFEALLAIERHDLPRFFADVESLAAMDKAARRASLDDLVGAGGGGTAPDALPE